MRNQLKPYLFVVAIILCSVSCQSFAGPQTSGSSKAVSAQAIFFLINAKLAKGRCDSIDPIRKCAAISDELCEYQYHFASVECEREANIQWLPKEQIQLIASELGPCTSRKFVAANKAKWLANAECSEWLKKRGNGPTSWVDTPALKVVRANTSPGEALSIEEHFKLKLSNDLERARVSVKLFEKEPKRFCPSYAKSDFGTCANSAIPKFGISSAVVIPLIAQFALVAMRNDIKLGYSPSIAGLKAAENLLSLLESTKPATFHLALMRANTLSEKTDLATLKANEEKLLAEGSLKLLKMTSDLLEKARTSRDPASFDAWKSAKLTVLNSRLSALKTRKWTLP